MIVRKYRIGILYIEAKKRLDVSPTLCTAAVQAARFWKACAEQAEDHATGAGSFRVALFDAAGSMTDEVFAGE